MLSTGWSKPVRAAGQENMACILQPHTQPDSMHHGRSSGLLCWMQAQPPARYLGSSCTARALPLETLSKWAPLLPRRQVRSMPSQRPFMRHLEPMARLGWMMVQMLCYVL